MKAKRLVNTKDLSREDWLKYRRMGIGGSDAPAIVGLSRWSNPLAVYLDKTSTTPPDDEESRFMYWGNVLEPVIAAEFAKQTGLQVKQCNYILQHTEHPFLLANIDREIIVPKNDLKLLIPHVSTDKLEQLRQLGKVGLECKNASAYKAKEWADDKTPEEYMIQCCHYMMVTDSPFWFLAVLIGGNDFAWRLIERDLELERDLFKLEADFWQLIQDKTPPAIDGSAASDDILKSLYPEAIIANTLTLPDDYIGVCSELLALKAEVKEIEARIKERENRLKEQMGDHVAAVCGRYQLSWSNVSSMKFDAAAFKEEQPELYEGYLIESKSRRFSIKQAKEKKAA